MTPISTIDKGVIEDTSSLFNNERGVVAERHISVSDALIEFCLVLYVASVLLFDYTAVYQWALLQMVLCILVFDRGWATTKITPIVLAYGGLLLYFAFHTILGLTQTMPQSVSRLASMATTFVSICCVAYIVQSRRCFNLVMKTVIVVGVIFAIYAFAVLGSSIWDDMAWNSIPKIFYSDRTYLHNDLPTVFALSCFFLRYKLMKMQPGSWKRLVCWVLIALFLALSLASGARKGIICILFALVVFPVFTVGDRKAFVSKCLLIALIGVCAYCLLVGIDVLYARIGYRFEAIVNGIVTGDYAESSARYRDMVARQAWEAIVDNWLIGYGLNSFGALSGLDGWTENTYLDLWHSGGILAVAIYVSFYVHAALVLIRVKVEGVESVLFLTLTLWFMVNCALTVAYSSRTLSIISCLISAYISVRNGNTLEQSNRFKYR